MKKILTVVGVVILALVLSYFGLLPGNDNAGVPETTGASLAEAAGSSAQLQQDSTGAGDQSAQATDTQSGQADETPALDPAGSYTTKEDVALYIYTYGRLPGNFITKSEARKLGWDGGSLEPYAPGKCIGGDRFGNHEGLLPKASGRTWTECDIGTLGGGSRGAKRIVFSNDGLIYYTDDHYNSFTLLYGEP